MAIASRYETGGDEVGLKLHRKILSRGASFLLDKCFKVEGAKDYTCGYRMYRRSVIKNAFNRYGENFIVENSFVCMAEILIKVAYLPARVAEVPLVLRYEKLFIESSLESHLSIHKFRYMLQKGISCQKDPGGR